MATARRSSEDTDVTTSTSTPASAMASTATPAAAAQRAGLVSIVAAFAAIYIVWGSTYLAIRYAIETMPPLLMAGTRFLAAGALLFAWARFKGAPWPTARLWTSTAVIGALMLLGGNGGLTWAEQRVPSGLAALLIATVPLWMVLMSAVPGLRTPGATRLWPSAQVVSGLVLGLAGLVILIGPAQFAGGGRLDLLGTVVLVACSLSWTIGSLLSRRLALPASSHMATAMEMLCGGALLCLAGLAFGEGPRVALDALQARSVLAWLYLVFAGSIVAFTAYVWLLRHVAPSRVATYAFVNPVVAVVLGWAFAGEPLSARTLIAAAVIVAAVAFVVMERR